MQSPILRRVSPPFRAVDNVQLPPTRFRHVSGNTRDAEADWLSSRAGVSSRPVTTAA